MQYLGKWGSGEVGWSLRARCGGKWGGGEVGSGEVGIREIR